MLKLLARLTETIISNLFPSAEDRADMYLPARYLSMSLVLMAVGIIAAVFAVLVPEKLLAIAVAVFCLGMGIAEFLCWKNQTIRVLTEDTFEYSTFLGNKKVYRFSDIVGFRRNKDSTTMFVADGKVHMESGAMLSERLIDRLNEQFGADDDDDDIFDEADEADEAVEPAEE
ncbi:MAG: hypothetical protein E7320_12375 [Clostridiales bacterium]|nr:hypothetical protein [Clostridiales bacterium]